jgi:hypothetical protein
MGCSAGIDIPSQAPELLHASITREGKGATELIAADRRAIPGRATYI